MRFLFTTLQFVESDFYRRVGERLRDEGHEVFHLAFSRRAAAALRRRGFRTFCLPDVMSEAGEGPGAAREAQRLERRYGLPSLRDVYRCDPAVRRTSEARALTRTVRHFRALEHVIDEVRPDVIVPEVGRETMREAALRVGVERGARVFFLVNSPFPDPLRLYVDDYDGPIVAQDQVRELSAQERAEVDAFVASFTERAAPVVSYRPTFVTAGKLRDFARHVAVRSLHERDNDYLRPSTFVSNYARQKAREAATRRLYVEAPPDNGRPFVYFPLHVTDDYKIERIIPHCADQEYLIRLVAESLPQGHDVVLKEHPHSLGPQPGRDAAAAREGAQRAPGRPLHELARAHAPRRRGHRHLLHRGPRGAPLRQGRADHGPALLRRLRGDGGRRVLPRAAHRGAGHARLRPRPRSGCCGSCTRACAPPTRARWSGRTTPTPTRRSWRARSPAPRTLTCRAP